MHGQQYWGTYANMHICTRSIQIYFWIFFDFILLSHSFHCSHTVTIFLIFFPIFVVILFTSKSLSFRHGTYICFHLGACVPTHRVESNCTIHITHAHLGMLSRVEAGARNWVYVGWDTHSHFPPQCSDSHWGGEKPLFLSFYCIN